MSGCAPRRLVRKPAEQGAAARELHDEGVPLRGRLFNVSYQRVHQLVSEAS